MVSAITRPVLRRNFVDAPYFITNPSICDEAGNPIIPPVPSHGGTVQGLQQFHGYGWVIPVANVASIFSIAFFNYFVRKGRLRRSCLESPRFTALGMVSRRASR